MFLCYFFDVIVQMSYTKINIIQTFKLTEQKKYNDYIILIFEVLDYLCQSVKVYLTKPINLLIYRKRILFLILLFS